MIPALRTLGRADIPALLELCATRPLDSLFVAHRVVRYGLGNPMSEMSVVGYQRAGKLVAACFLGNNLVPIGGDPVARKAFAEIIGPRKNTWSIMGEQHSVVNLHRCLVDRWGQSWGRTRHIRPDQPLLMIDHDPLRPADPRVGQITLADFDAYYAAAVAMYTEEVGLSPVDQRGSYERYVRSLIENGQAFGGIHRGRVWFKADMGLSWGDYCQVQGVWLDPKLRGRGLSESAMASVVVQARKLYPVVSLYVNDYNIRARKLYAALGFRQAGTMATVLY